MGSDAEAKAAEAVKLSPSGLDADDEAAAASFKMISASEGRVRQGVGAFLLLTSLCTSYSGLIMNSAGVMLIAMGRLSQ